MTVSSLSLTERDAVVRPLRLDRQHMDGEAQLYRTNRGLPHGVSRSVLNHRYSILLTCNFVKDPVVVTLHPSIYPSRAKFASWVGG